MRPSLVLFAATLLGAAGCELLSSVDRSKIPGETGGAGGTGGATTSVTSSGTGGTNTGGTGGTNTGGTGGMTTSSTSGTGGMGTGGTGGMGTGGMGTGGTGTGGMGTGGMGTGGMGTGGAPQCTTAAQCPQGANECQTATCTNGQCGITLAAADTLANNQTAHDCKKNVCDAAGNIVSANDDADVPDDSNPCTTDTCTNGTPANTPVASGTSCGTNLVCNATGQCVGCNVATDCPGQDTTCQTRTCTGGMCGFNFASAGTPAGTQTAGDCHKSQCDGAGAIVSVVDDTDVPVDNKQCTTDVCTNGTPSNPAASAGTGCTQNGGTKCDGNGACVQCTQASDCGTNTACKTFTCNAGVCGSNNAAAGTVVSNPTAGDCKSDQCDGNGNLLSGAADANDKPNDNNQCTNDVCTGTTPSNPPVASGTGCSQNGGTKCNGAGACVQCLQASDCGTNTACKTFTCNAGVCGSNNAQQGTVAANPTVGDCKSDQCDGNGNIVPGVADGTDQPNDNNQCTNDTCNAGTPVFVPLAAGTVCSQNGGSHCDGNGACVQCFQASDCGTNTACRTFTCNAGLCGTNNAASGTVVSNPTAGDCKSDQCDGNGNLVPNANDNNDKPADDGNQCTLEVCNAGTPAHPAAPQGKSCNQNGGSTCDGAGNCVACQLDTDCPTGGACQAPKCNAGTCGFVAAAPMVLPPAAQTAGDCQQLTCDGVSQTPVSVADNSDAPADDGNQCTNDTCTAGAPVHPPVGAGVLCNQNGGSRCDGNGACVQCVVNADCPAGGNPCQVGACNAGTCGFAAATAQTLPAAQQTAGDCQKLTCDGTSQTPVSVADNTDVPADDGNQCTLDTCSSGAPVHPAASAGTMCNQNGGTVCDGAGSCVGGPGVASTTPADGGTANARTTIAVTFTQAMNATTLTGQTTAGACTGSIQVSLNDFTSCIAFSSAAPVMSGGQTVATFTAQPGLLVNRTYKVRVTTAAQSAANVPLTAAFTSPTGFGTTTAGHLDGSLVISQVYGGGGSTNTSASYKSDYVVLHNRGTTTVNLAGLSLQYAGATGTSWSSTPAALSGSIPPGGYFLVQLSTSTGGATLPTADLTTSGSSALALAAGAGKIALVTGTTTMTAVACPDTTRVVDFVAYGTTNCSEGSTSGATSAGALSITTAAIRNTTGCADTNVNSADFTVGTPAPRNSTTTPAICEITQNESGNALEADYCDTQFPLSLSVQTGAMSTVYGQIYEAGTTDPAGASAGVLAQFGYGPLTANPEYESGWTWLSTTYNTQQGNNDEYQASFAAPAVGTYRYVYRFSLDSGASWTYCDNNQGDAGAGANAGLTFNLEDMATLTVTP